MTTLYRPVKITSAEQAEALPEGTIATHDEHWPAERCTPNRWESSARDMKHEEMLGWTALVPIEAEERIGSEMCHQISDKRYDIHVLPAGDEKQARWQIENNPDYATGRIMRQYRTPWEEA